MAADYPGAIKTFSAVVNGITKLVMALFNSPYDEITAIQTELGTDPAGSYTDVKTRLNSTTTLGSWVDKSASYGAQQAATDGFVSVAATYSGGDQSVLATGYTDTSNPPTTVRCYASAVCSLSHGEVRVSGSFCMPVKKNSYWKVVLSNPYGSGGSMTVYWIPIGA